MINKVVRFDEFGRLIYLFLFEFNVESAVLMLNPGCVWKEREENIIHCLERVYKSFPSILSSYNTHFRFMFNDMQTFQTYPLSPCYSIKSPKDGRFIVVDDKQSFPRLTSNDSGISFGESDNESIFSDEYEFDIDQNYIQQPITITNDVHMASFISDDEKKFFCDNTVWAWHGEFGRLIMARAMTYNVDYRLMLYDAHSLCPRALNAYYSMIRLDNAKAQFKCDTCGHCWTSMRARCSFYISKPNEGGIVLLKLYTQQCQYCYSTVYPLWYYDEICRVMKNLAFTIFEHFFPNSFQSIYWDLTHNGIKSVRRLFQRKGYMHSQHNPLLCEACHYGFCY